MHVSGKDTAPRAPNLNRQVLHRERRNYDYGIIRRFATDGVLKSLQKKASIALVMVYLAASMNRTAQSSPLAGGTVPKLPACRWRGGALYLTASNLRAHGSSRHRARAEYTPSPPGHGRRRELRLSVRFTRRAPAIETGVNFRGGIMASRGS
jgi:hypothetical protein